MDAEISEDGIFTVVRMRAVGSVVATCVATSERFAVHCNSPESFAMTHPPCLAIKGIQKSVDDWHGHCCSHLGISTFHSEGIKYSTGHSQ